MYDNSLVTEYKDFIVGKYIYILCKHLCNIIMTVNTCLFLTLSFVNVNTFQLFLENIVWIHHNIQL